MSATSGGMAPGGSSHGCNGATGTLPYPDSRSALLAAARSPPWLRWA